MQTIKHLKKYGVGNGHKVVDIVWYGNDHPGRPGLVRRFLVEVCGRDPDSLTAEDIDRLDHVPIEGIMRPLVVADSRKISTKMLATRFNITYKTVDWLLFRR